MTAPTDAERAPRSRWKPMTAEERFWSHVDKRGPNECWEWQASHDGRRYGCFSVGGRNVKAPRFSYSIAHRVTLTRDQFVCHACDNPPCVNPAHLWLGDALSNVRDAVAKGRMDYSISRGRVNSNRLKDRCRAGHEFTAGSFRLNSLGCKVCRVCARLRYLRFVERRRLAGIPLRAVRGAS